MCNLFVVVSAILAFTAAVVESTCETDWFESTGFCYYLSNGDGLARQEVTWRQARDWCLQHAADLVTVQNDEERTFLSDIVSELTSS